MTEEESYYVSALLKQLYDRLSLAGRKFGIQMYLHGVDHGKQGIEIDPEQLFDLLEGKTD